MSNGTITIHVTARQTPYSLQLSIVLPSVFPCVRPPTHDMPNIPELNGLWNSCVGTWAWFKGTFSQIVAYIEVCHALYQLLNVNNGSKKL